MLPLFKLCADQMLYSLIYIRHLQLLFIQRYRTAQMILTVVSGNIRLQCFYFLKYYHHALGVLYFCYNHILVWHLFISL